MLRYFIIYKPFEVLSQFTSAEQKRTLSDLLKLPSDVYPVGRLDYDSEGLLLLTNDKQINHRLLNPVFKHQREYWVQVEGTIGEDAITKLKTGTVIRIDGKDFRTARCEAGIFKNVPEVPERFPPIRERKNIPTSWLHLTLTEGKNRQVRRMTASVGYPTLRLIRYRIEKLTIQNMQPADVRELSRTDFYTRLFN